MNKIKIALLTGLISVSPFAAADLSYTNFGVGYVDGDWFNADSDGFQLRGSFALNSDLFLLGSYDALDVDAGIGSFDLDILAFGVGYRNTLSSDMDFVATASILDVDIGIGSTDGIRLTGGVRGMANSEIEYTANLVYEDIDDVDDDIGFEIGGRYYFTRENSFGVTLRDVNNLETLRLDVRFDF